MISSLIITMLLSLNTQAKPLSVLVIDSGVNEKYVHRICATGNISFIKDFKGEVIPWSQDIQIPHGSNVVSIIENTAQVPGYCITMYKVFSDNKNYDIDNLLGALREAKKHHFDIINLSLGGNESNSEEKNLIKELLDGGSIIVNAAGNQSKNLDQECNWFPACYDSRIVIVGSASSKGVVSKFSNYSYSKSNMIYVLGEELGGAGYLMSGTSQAAACFTGGLVRYILKHKLDLSPTRSTQSFTSGDKSKVQQALFIQLGLKEQTNKFLEWYYTNVPDTVQLIGGWAIPIYKAYGAGILVVEKKF